MSVALRKTLPTSAAAARRVVLALAFFAAIAGISTARAADVAGPQPAQRVAAAGGAESGDWQRVIDASTETLESKSSPVDARIEALRERAQALQQLGFLNKAIADLTMAIDLAANRASTAQQVALHGTLGNAYVAAGQFEPAERQLNEALLVARSAGDRQAEIVTELNLGMLHSINSAASAETELRAIGDDAEAAGAPLLAARASVGAGRLALKRGDFAALDRDLAATWRRLEQSQTSHDRAFTLIAAARLEQAVVTRGGSPAARAARRAFEALDAAARWAEAAGDARALSYAWGYMAQLYEADGKRDEALELTNRAIFAVEKLYAPEIVYLWDWQSGRLLRDAGKTEDAIAAYRRAIAALQSIRSDLTLDMLGGRLSFRDVVGPIFLETADLLLRHAPGTVTPQNRLIEARQTLETMKGAELQDYFADDCVASLQARLKPIDRLAPDTAALYPIVLPDRMELILSFGDGLRQVTVPVPADRIRQEVARLRRLVEKRTTNEYLAPSRQLYDWMIRPLEKVLDGASIATLIIVPDEVFRTIPLAALNDGKRFLIERYALAVTPGLSLMDPRPLPRQNVSVLLGGLTEAVQGFRPLPRVAQEVADIRTHYDANLLENEQFLTASVGAALRKTPYTIVHFASHGEFRADERKSFILTYDGKLTMDMLEQDVKYARFRENPVELLTLSACDTAVGDDRAALGLAGIAIKAGARSAVATLWSVSDGASAELVSDFYSRLSDARKSKAEALREAQLAVLADARYRHPYYWAPFLLIGNWL